MKQFRSKKREKNGEESLNSWKKTLKKLWILFQALNFKSMYLVNQSQVKLRLFMVLIKNNLTKFKMIISYY